MKIQKYINKKQNILKVKCEKEIRFAIPMQVGQVFARFIQTGPDISSDINSVFNFQKGTIEIKAHSDEPCEVHFISYFNQIFPHFQASASFFNTDQRLFQVTSSLKNKFGNFSFIPSAYIAIQGSPNSVQEIKPSMLDIHLSLSLLHKPQQFSFLFQTFRASKIMTFETLFKKPFVFGVNMKYNYKKFQLSDITFVLSHKSSNTRVSFSGSKLSSSLDLFATRRFSESFKGGLSLSAQNISQEVNLVAQLAGKFKIDERSYSRFILSTDLSIASEFCINYQDILNFQFTGKITGKKGGPESIFGSSILFDLLQREV